MQRIQDICKTQLDNAHLVKFSLNGDGLSMKFDVGGTEEIRYEVDFKCSHVHFLSITNDPEDEFADCNFVGGVRVRSHEGAEEVGKLLGSAGWR